MPDTRINRKESQTTDMNGYNRPDLDILSAVCRSFRIDDALTEARLLTGGNINTTYYVRCADGREYLVQRINCYVFRDPVSVMSNIDLVTRHIIEYNNAHGLYDHRSRLHFHHTENGKNYILRGGDEFWRVSNFIQDTVSFETGSTEELLEMTGKAFGRFQKQLSDFDASLLAETIPDFHNTPKRLSKLFEDERIDECGRCAAVMHELDFIRENADVGSSLKKALDSGELPSRVTHNDTKINNVLFDRVTLEPVAVVDLDTVMPGLAAYDFGDAVRSAACTTSEDEEELSLVKFDLSRFEAFAKGFIGQTAGILTDAEIMSLPKGAAVIALELASRFLDDYITGDKYFRCTKPQHNLIRARCQLALYRDIISKMDEMNAIVRRVAGIKG